MASSQGFHWLPMFPSDLTERLFFLTHFAYQYRCSQIEIPFYFGRLLFDGFSLQGWWLWVRWKCHHRLSRDRSEGAFSDRQKCLYTLSSCVWEMMNHRTQWKGRRVMGGWMSVWRGASQLVCDKLTRFLQCYSSHNHFKSENNTKTFHTSLCKSCLKHIEITHYLL